jgi:hypothetical protein
MKVIDLEQERISRDLRKQVEILHEWSDSIQSGLCVAMLRSMLIPREAIRDAAIEAQKEGAKR